MNRRDFIKQLALLPTVAVLPALPGVEIAGNFSPSLAWEEASRKGLVAMVKAMQAPSNNHWANLQMGIEASINELLAQTQGTVQAMIEQIEREL